jgi:magnesium chelatase family protein
LHHHETGGRKPKQDRGTPGFRAELAWRILSILLPLCIEAALGCTKIYSNSGLLLTNTGLITTRPFRSPHHSISDAGLLGGSIPRPGNVSLAHHGVPVLDELPEFRRAALEALRQPLEDGLVTLAQATPLRLSRM